MARKKKPTSKKRGRRSGKKGRKKKTAGQKPESRAGAAPPSPDVGLPEKPSEPSEAAAEGASTGPEPAAAGAPQDDPGVTDLDANEKPSAVDLDANDEPVLIDLDADDDEAAEAVDRLIAETLAIVPGQETAPEEDEPVIDLDADVQAREIAEPPTPEAVATESRDAAAPGDAGTPTPKGELPDRVAAPRQTPGPLSTPEVRDRLLAQALAHAAHKDAQYRVPYAGVDSPRRWKTLVAAVLLSVAGVVVLAPPRWTRPDPPAQIGPATRARNLRVALVLQAEQIEAFRVRMQRLPAALEEVRATLPGVRYVRSGNRSYQLIAYEPDGSAIVYDSASPTAASDSVRAAWAQVEAAP